jgi:hypothetical protein
MTDVSYFITTDPTKFETTVMTTRDSETYFRIVCDPGHERTARELRQLPRESRERVWADMTGDPNTTYYSINPEEAAFVVDKLHEMHVELERIRDKPAYKLAFQISPDYVNDPAFLLLFLRSDGFDPSLAAQRFVNHLEQKLVLFGKEKLAVPIAIKDLSPDDLEALSCGGIQLLPCTDRGGRLILMSRYCEFVYKKRENMVSGKPMRGVYNFSKLLYLFLYCFSQNPANSSGQCGTCYRQQSKIQRSKGRDWYMWVTKLEISSRLTMNYFVDCSGVFVLCPFVLLRVTAATVMPRCKRWLTLLSTWSVLLCDCDCDFIKVCLSLV